jgi:hypothetical protein
MPDFIIPHAVRRLHFLCRNRNTAGILAFVLSLYLALVVSSIATDIFDFPLTCRFVIVGAQLYADASIYMPLRISIWDDRGPNFEDSLIAEVTFEAIEIYQSVGHIKSETLPNGAVYVTDIV